MLIAVHPSLVSRAPEVVEFLRVWHLAVPAQIAALEWMAEHEATVDETAIWFLRNLDVWIDWVPQDVEQRVKDALADEVLDEVLDEVP